MKRFLSILLAFTFLLTPFVAFSVLPQDSFAYVSVKGYYRKDGTYVRPHVRSNPNGLKYDNYGYTPSQGLYNDSYGTRGSEWDTPTYITDPDYYEGKVLYESGSTGSVSTPTQTYQSASANSYRSNLTENQIQAILGLLRAFNTDQVTITNVELSLRN